MLVCLAETMSLRIGFTRITTILFERYQVEHPDCGNHSSRLVGLQNLSVSKLSIDLLYMHCAQSSLVSHHVACARRIKHSCGAIDYCIVGIPSDVAKHYATLRSWMRFGVSAKSRMWPTIATHGLEILTESRSCTISIALHGALITC